MAFISMSGGGKIEDVLATQDWFVDQHIQGRLWGWGFQSSNETVVGNGGTTAVLSPTQIGSDTNWTKIIGDTKGSERWAANFNGNVYGWGYNLEGQLGDGTRTKRSSPVVLSTLKNANTIVHNDYNNCAALKNDGTIWTWGGDNYYFSYMDGSNNAASRNTPQQAGTKSDWRHITSTRFDFYLVDSTGKFYRSGISTTPIEISGWIYPNIKKLLTGPGGTFDISFLTEEGKVYHYSSLIGSTPVNSHSQLPATSLQFVDLATAGSYDPNPAQFYSRISWIGIAQDGTMWGVGANESGVLGLGDTTRRNSWTQIGTAKDWKSVYMDSSNSYYTMAIKQDGSLWAWGSNDSGQLGLGNTTNTLTPTRVGAANYWKSAQAAGKTSHALSYY